MKDLIEFFEPPITIGWDVEPTQALEFLKGKGLRQSFSWADVSAAEHAASFTVAKMLDNDLLAEVKASLEAAMAEGKPYQQWADEITPLLQAKGWWGRQKMVDPMTGATIVAQLGSPGRLQTIFRTNLASAYSVGEWEQIAAQAATAPYLMYDAVDDYRTRPEHATWDGKVRPVNDPFWRSHMPPNGWNCRCGVVQLSKDDLEELGIEVSPPEKLKFYDWTNPRTGKVEKIPEGLDPGFNYNPGQARLEHLAKLAAEKAAAMAPDAAKAAAAGLKATQSAIETAAAEMARKAITEASAAGAKLAQAGKAAERAAAAQIKAALDQKTPYLQKAILEVQKMKGAKDWTATEILAAAKEKAAKVEASAAIANYKQSILAGKKPGGKAQAAFDALPEEAQTAIAEQLQLQLAEQAAQTAAKAYLAQVADLPNTQLGKALAKVDQTGKKPTEILAEAKAIANAAGAKQAQAQGLAGYKKAAASGKAPTPAQKAAFEALDDDGKAKVLAQIEADKAAAAKAANKAPVEPAQTAKPGTPVSPTSDLDPDSLTQIGPQRGSNPGGLYQDTSTGQQWYVKFPANPEQARNEVLAGKLYEAAGIDTPDLRLITVNGKTAIASKIVPDLAKGTVDQLAAKAADGFAVDAWLANWDVVGLSYDNLLLQGAKVYRVDTGGALRFRAQGGLKGRAFGDTVDELESLRNAGTNPQSAAVFKSVTQTDLEAGARRVLAITDDQIRKLVDEYGPLDATERTALVKTLIARREDLGRRFPNARPAAAKPVPVSTARVTAAEQKSIEDSRANGYTMVTDDKDIEDHNVVVMTYTDAAGKPKTRVSFKLRPEALAKLEQRANEAGNGKTRVLDYRATRDKAKELLKGINARAARGDAIDAKTMSRWAEFETEIENLRQQWRMRPAEVRAIAPDAPATLKALGKLEGELIEYFDKHQTGTKASPVPIFDFDAIPDEFTVALKAAESEKRLEWKRKSGWKYQKTRIERGRVVETADAFDVSSKASRTSHYATEVDGDTIRVAGKGNAFAFEGNVQIDLDGVGPDVTARAFQRITEMGVDSKRAGELERLELYLDRHLYARTLREGSVKWQGMESIADRAQRIEAKQKYLNELAGFDVRTSPDWDPFGKHQAFGHGRVTLARADLDQKELADFERDHVLFHNPAGLSWEGGDAVLEKFKLLVEVGGQLASLVDRVRRGVSIEYGSSVESDLDSGGGSYNFLRVSKRKGGHAKTKGAGFYFRSRLVRRSDAISYDHDAFGRSTNRYQTENRKISLKEIAAGSANRGNETIFRDAVSLFDDAEFIALDSDRQVAEAIKFMRAQGYTSWPDGRKLEDVIVNKRSLPYTP